MVSVLSATPTLHSYIAEAQEHQKELETYDKQWEDSCSHRDRGQVSWPLVLLRPSLNSHHQDVNRSEGECDPGDRSEHQLPLLVCQL